MNLTAREWLTVFALAAFCWAFIAAIVFGLVTLAVALS